MCSSSSSWGCFFFTYRWVILYRRAQRVLNQPASNKGRSIIFSFYEVLHALRAISAAKVEHLNFWPHKVLTELHSEQLQNGSILKKSSGRCFCNAAIIPQLKIFRSKTDWRLLIGIFNIKFWQHFKNTNRSTTSTKWGIRSKMEYTSWPRLLDCTAGIIMRAWVVISSGKPHRALSKANEQFRKILFR